MNAQDGRSGHSRLADVRDDIETLEAKNPGTRFGIVTLITARRFIYRSPQMLRTLLLPQRRW